ncbi:hypothetical protein [Defluviimonas sp. WL0075]|uniref:DUF3329 domain-containing protein n=1 Tax=Albidovulum sediminicola TaxID=2984331 RepID=A0ABT2Z3V9_9RHOB|nr:hypothetical protein [Defluviimonas sp. WL0075]MCV2865690.1 hypothetical protein [Defluviimonas sp. WL0075]
MARFLDRDHPMFRQTWVRAVTVAVPLVGAGFELTLGSPLWGAIFAGLAGYALWELFLRGPRGGDRG